MTRITTLTNMRPISAADLLDVWEWGLTHTQPERALALLAAVCPEQPVDELAGKPIGQRNVALLSLRESLFGSELALLTVCPQCAESLEMQVPIAALTANAGATDDNEGYQTLEANGASVRFRLPNSLDLLVASTSADPRGVLIERCLETPHDDTELQPASLPTEIETSLVAKMQMLDPLANVSFALRCPSCETAWDTQFDIVSYLWTEIEAWAHRTLREVHWLASIYHWREADILGLGQWRRQAYLQMSGYA